jgi:DNA-binding SARP family transcriptional activator
MSHEEEGAHVGTEQSRGADELGAEERQRLRRAHERLRTASKDLEVLIATEPIKNRWAPEPAPAEILDAARADLRRAYADLERCQHEILGWEPTPGQE